MNEINNTQLLHKNKSFVRKLPKSKGIFIVGVLMAFFLISIISASLLTTHGYSEDDMKVEFNTLWIFEKGDITLKSHSYSTQVLEVGFGEEEVVMYYDFDWGSLEEDGLGKVYFTNMTNGEVVEKTYTFVRWENVSYQSPVYEEECNVLENQTKVCSDVITGYINQVGEEWVEYKSRDIPEGKSRIGLKTYVGEGDHYDAVWTIAGDMVIRHSEWTASLNVGLISYWNLNEASGIITDSVQSNDETSSSGKTPNATGILDRAVNFSGSSSVAEIGGTYPSGANDVSLSLWVKTDAHQNDKYMVSYGASGTDTMLGWNTFSNNFQLNTGNNVMDSGVAAVDGTWFNLVWVDNGTVIVIYVDGVLKNQVTRTMSKASGQMTFGNFPGATSAALDGSLDEVGIWNRTLSQAEVTQLYNGGDAITWTDVFENPPNVTVNAPVDELNSTLNTITLNCTVSDGLNLSNVTFYVNDVAEFTNTSGVNNSEYTFIHTFSEGTSSWICGGVNNNSEATNSTARNVNIDTAPQINIISPTQGQNITVTTVFFNATNSLPVDTWIVNFNGTNVTLPDINTSLEVAQGVYSLIIYANNSVTGAWGLNDSINFTVHLTAPSLFVTAPSGNFESLFNGESMEVNWSIFELGVNLTEHIKNCSVTYNGVTTTHNTSVCIVTNSSTINYVSGVNNLTMNVIDQFDFITTNTTSWTVSLVENNVTFDNTTFETQREEFVLNFSTTIDVLSISAILNYDGVTDISTTSCTNGNCIVSNDLDIPLVPTEPTENTFFWNVTIFNGTESISISTSNRTQNVSMIFLEQCNATFPTQTLNFTTYDEQDLSQIDPFDFNGAFDFWLGGGDVKKNNSFSVSTTEVLLCLSPNETMTIDADINYDEAADTNYTQRTFYFQSFEISNSSQDILMYLLKSVESTSFILKVQDENLLPLNNTIVEILRYYPGTDEFRLVQTAKTNDAGKSVGFFEVETVDYKFIIRKDGEILLETGQGKVIPETSPFTLTFNTGENLGAPWSSQEGIPNIDSSLVFNSDTGIVTYTYIDSSTTFEQGRLFVQKESFTNSSAYETICNETSTLTSATLTCDTSNETGTYIASGFITRSAEALDEQINFGIDSLSEVAGLLGLFFGWFLILIAASMFTVNEVAGIWTITLTIFLINTMGLIKFGGVFVTAIFAIAIIITWLLEK